MPLIWQNRLRKHLIFVSFYVGQMTLSSCAAEKSETNLRSESEDIELDGELTKLWSQKRGKVFAALTDSAAPSSALKILEDRCFSCHGANGVALGSVGNITDVKALIASGKLVPGQPERSTLFTRMLDTGSPMPPRPAEPVPEDQIEIVRQWILQMGQPPAPEPTPPAPAPTPPAPAPTPPAPEATPPGGEASSLKQEAQKILSAKCATCHSSSTQIRGGIKDITDTKALVEKGTIVPGQPDLSPLLKRVRSSEKPMPPPPLERLSDAEIKTLADWVKQIPAPPQPAPIPPPAPPGEPEDTQPPPAPAPPPVVTTPTAGAPPQTRPFVSLREEFQLVLNDLITFESQGRNEARNKRYLSLVPLYNNGTSRAKLKEHANSLSRIINHLSTRSQIVQPVAINAEQTIFRIDLRDYAWSANEWNQITRDYPYRELLPDREFKRIFQRATGESNTLVRGDWFALHATQPENYHLLLRTPNNLRGAEREFRFDLSSNIARQADRGGNLVMRSGFLKSGVSLSNRVFERHQVFTGGFWISYDFEKTNLQNKDQNVLRKNVFSAPLGPKVGNQRQSRSRNDFVFDHSAGEVIAHLPNGLFWYMLADANGNRVSIAPTNIVVDPARPDGIINGYSCMNCHAAGLLTKNDEVRANANKLRGLTRQEQNAIFNLYPPRETMSQTMELDNRRYRASIAAASIDPTVPSASVLSLAQSYEAFVTAATAASELGIGVEDFKLLVQSRVSRDIQNQLSPLLSEEGQISRNLYEPVVDDLLNEIVFNRRSRR